MLLCMAEVKNRGLKKKKKMNSEENYGLENLILWYLGNTLGKNF